MESDSSDVLGMPASKPEIDDSSFAALCLRELA